MNEIEIIDTNVDNIYDYGFCGIKNIKQEGYKRKTDWLIKRFSEGMRFKILHSAKEGFVGMIEYIPGRYAWRAVGAKGYMVIHCLFVLYKKYQRRGYGSQLIEECIKDAKREKMNGVAVVTRKGPWLAKKELFLKNGFELVDKAPPDFELLMKRFKKGAPSPKFRGDWRERLNRYSKGLTIIRSDQCPYLEKWVKEISETAREKFGLKAKIVELKTCQDAQSAPSAYATFSIVYNGKLLADHPISNKRFINIMNKEVK
ncbi:MAG: GNAT family N-acetyltransferase [Candidatus Aminicenantes bacterium]|nr:GNAT family N-acetyltransferase [Candidatus Aminicenantes bacterium]